MDMISIRRKLMAKTQSQPAPSGYVTDGLVLWLDGINKGSTARAWTDLVDGHVFLGGTTAVFGNDYVEFDKSSNSWLRNSSFDTPRSGVGTIEIVYSAYDTISSAEIVAYSPKDIGDLAFGIYRGRTIWDKQYSSNVKNTYPGYQSGSYSIRAGAAYYNGLAQTPGSFDFWKEGNTDLNIVGGISNNANRSFYGKIYCIRIYNRYLTQEEVLANYAVDQSRFSLFN